MKKNDQDKEFQKNRAEKEERRKRKRKEKKKRLRQDAIGKKQKRKAMRKLPQIWAPEKLTLQFGYSEEVLSFINRLKQLGEVENEISMRLDNVTDIGEGAIAMLLSVINELTLNNVTLVGEKPHNNYARNALERSGFFKYMRGYVAPENLKTKNIIIRTGNINTSQKELSPEMPKAMETVWGEAGRCPELFGGIGEMLRNTCDHAFDNGHKITWHLGVSHIEKDKTVKFSFVDNGIGIIKTYYDKGLIQKVKGFFKDNAEVLENAFKRGIDSRTGLPWRGKGLPTIYDLYEDNIITNLVVITNNVYLDFDRKTFEEIKVPFSGTYYFWKVDQTCERKYFV